MAFPRRTLAISGSKSRNKGAAWERECAKLLTQMTGVECKRRLEQYRSGGADIDTTLPISVECKTGYQIGSNTIRAALQQAREGAENLELPFVWVKQNVKGKSPERYVVMDEETFLPMLLAHLENVIP